MSQAHSSSTNFNTKKENVPNGEEWLKKMQAQNPGSQIVQKEGPQGNPIMALIGQDGKNIAWYSLKIPVALNKMGEGRPIDFGQTFSLVTRNKSFSSLATA
jgi:hypothetical protein